MADILFIDFYHPELTQEHMVRVRPRVGLRVRDGLRDRVRVGVRVRVRVRVRTGGLTHTT